MERRPAALVREHHQRVREDGVQPPAAVLLGSDVHRVHPQVPAALAFQRLALGCSEGRRVCQIVFMPQSCV